MSERKVGPTEFKAEVEQLHAAGKLPSLGELLGAVVEVRKEYAPRIIDARNQGDDGTSQ